MVWGRRGPSRALTVPPFPPAPGKCFLYCNGLMDHLYVCQNGPGCTAWYKAPTRFTGTLVGAAGVSPCGVGCSWGCVWGVLAPLPPSHPPLGAALSPQDAFVKITRYEGIRSLWSGLPPTL